MAKQTRLATTITTQFLQHQGAADAFYLDGRLSAPQKFRSKDITLDRTDEGFYFAIFASTDLSRESNRTYQQKKRSLDRITELIKDEGRGNIDSAINDMAENSVHVTGRLSLADSSTRHPYYAGVLVRDAEMAAVTMASGLAYLYRDDTLYPLTQDDFPLDAVDASGRTVDNFDIYGAGKAGTIRYSNISQIQVDDCIILCTREVMESIGQSGMLELLDKAYDQQEAAELVSEHMADHLPDTPFQFLMSFVEDIFQTPRGRRRSDSSAAQRQAGASISETAMTDETTRFDPKAISPYSAVAAGLVKDEPVVGPDEVGPGEEIERDVFYSRPEDEHQPTDESDQPVGTVYDEHPEDSSESEEGYEPDRTSDTGRFDTRETGFVEETQPLAGAAGSVFSDSVDPEAGEDPDLRTGEHRLYAQQEDIDLPYEDQRVEEPPVSQPQPVMSPAESLRRELPEEENAWDEDGIDAGGPDNRRGKILLTVLIILLLALVFVGIAYLLNRRGDDTPVGTGTGVTTENVQTDVTDSTTSTEETTTAPTTEPTTEATTTVPTTTLEDGLSAGANGGTFPSTYDVVSGDNFIRIINSVYEDYNTEGMSQSTLNELIELFVEENPDTITGSVENNNVMIYAGTTINVPDPSNILDVIEE